MTHSFLERIGQPEVDLANDPEESVPFNVLDATFILELSSSQMFSMLFRDSLSLMETETNALILHLFSSFIRHKCSRCFSMTHLVQGKLKEML